jgi:hypothetical protein
MKKPGKVDIARDTGVTFADVTRQSKEKSKLVGHAM